MRYWGDIELPDEDELAQTNDSAAFRQIDAPPRPERATNRLARSADVDELMFFERRWTRCAPRRAGPRRTHL
jgi:hypothetical protein